MVFKNSTINLLLDLQKIKNQNFINSHPGQCLFKYTIEDTFTF